MKEKRRDEELIFLDLYFIVVFIVFFLRRGCLFDLLERGFKRKVGCIYVFIWIGRKRKFEKYYDLGFELG